MIAGERFPPKVSAEEVRLYVTPVRRPHIEVAYVQSFADISQDTETRRAQLRELRETARRVGADAVMEVRQMKNQVRGFVQDERTPFRSYTQDRYDMHFFRGIAVRFVEDEEEAARHANPARRARRVEPDLDTSTGEIPAVITRQPDRDDQEGSSSGNFLPF